MSNSSLATYTLISPNKNSPRNHRIDTISIHCFVGQVTAKRGCEVFQPTSKEASCNYVVGYDGSIGLCVDEGDRSWCTSSAANDHRAVTIETASDNKEPYAVTDKAYAALLNLVTDICRRNGAKKLLWFGDKAKTLAYTPKAGEMVMTVHRWFANKSCPGNYLYNLHGEIAAEVTKRLSGGSGSTAPAPGASGGAQTAVNYTVKVTATDLNIRSGPGTNSGSTGAIKPGIYTIVAEAGGTGASKWGKLKSGAGWISLDYATKTGTSSSTASKAVTVGSTVTIQAGAVYGGLATSRGAKVPDYVSGKNRRYTVKQIATHKGVQEALLKEITSWVALSYLTVV
ncbi:N-acetylmuramoyl-L-alanine amidase [Dysosmobacter welbionis]|uniref:N-acetylmuramoyl-L-alanine amidase n=1 Tax=Dysosmobacter welbionis TaxID=2093857 RepID=UPI00307A927F